jgi:hypothetical protein
MEFDMTYNTQEDRMMIAEYGRHIQNLINYNKTIEDDKKRQAFAEQIIDLMYQMNAQSKNTLDFKSKLWKHFFIIANYEIKVVPTSGSVPLRENRGIKPDIVEYPSIESEFRHYGHNVRLMMEKALKMEEGPIKDGFVETIASFMKLAFKNWNKEHYVSDEIILEDLRSLSKGKLSVSDESSIDTLTSAVTIKKRRPINISNNNNRRKPPRNNNHRRRR